MERPLRHTDQPLGFLSGEQILGVWEAGREQHELDRALTILAAALPESSREELADLSIGELNTRLLKLRTLMFGARAVAFAECPRCSERLEFPIDTATMARPTTITAQPYQFEVNGTRVRFRLPSSRDLAEVVAARDSSHALRQLVRNCVVEVIKAGLSDPGELQPELVDALAQAMLDADALAEISIALTCPNCGHEWETFFEVADFFWNELAARATRLLREIDTLARTYGWNEREILALSVRRRQTYLELIEA